MPDAAIFRPDNAIPRRRRRTILATWLYFRYLLIEFRWSLFLLGFAVLLGEGLMRRMRAAMREVATWFLAGVCMER